MTWLDYVFIGLLLLAAISGLRKGALKKIFDLVAILIGVILGLRFTPWILRFIPSAKISPLIGTVISIIIFIALCWILLRVTATLLRSSNPVLSLADKLAGACIALMETTFVASVVLNIAFLFGYPSVALRNSSLFYEPISSVLPAAYNVAIRLVPEARTFADEMKGLVSIDSMKEQFLQHGHK